MDSVAALEEIERIQNEFGPCRLLLPDPVQQWWYDVDRLEFDLESQSIRFVSDH